ncbi:hypothetical protein AB0F52_31390 [Amycolatopsis sp. NPDC024027]|uniref:hypothetical protein n=1 Tax=Amycolatopsis sp. NPDC024027 TaxID=3154327 RepID=UPI0033CE66A9
MQTDSTAAYRTAPTMAVYATTKTAVRTISEGLRQEAGPDLRLEWGRQLRSAVPAAPSQRSRSARLRAV